VILVNQFHDFLLPITSMSGNRKSWN